MKIAPDKKLHLLFGVFAVVGALLVSYFYATFGVAWAVLLAGGIMGGAYEGVQYARKDGEVSHQDALFTTIPSVLFFLVHQYFS